MFIFRKQEKLVYTRTHMCYPEMDNMGNVHSKNNCFTLHCLNTKIYNVV